MASADRLDLCFENSRAVSADTEGVSPALLTLCSGDDTSGSIYKDINLASVADTSAIALWKQMLV